MFKLFLPVTKEEPTKKKWRVMLPGTFPCTCSLLRPDPNPAGRYETLGRAWSQPPVPARLDTKPSRRVSAQMGKPETEGCVEHSALSSRAKTGRPGLAASSPVWFQEASGRGSVLGQGEVNQKQLPLGSSQSLLCTWSLWGDQCQPSPPPERARAGTLKANHWAFWALGPARPAPAGGSSGAAGGAASG